MEITCFFSAPDAVRDVSDVKSLTVHADAVPREGELVAFNVKLAHERPVSSRSVASVTWLVTQYQTTANVFLTPNYTP